MGALLFLFYFAIAVAIAGPFVFSLAFYKWWQKRNLRATVFLILAGVLLPYSYLVYDAFYPSDSFYKEEFVKLTNFPFPATGNITKKSASYPDIHGDYAACAQIEVSRTEYDGLLEHFANNPSYAYDSTTFIGCEEFYWVTNNIDKNEYVRRFATGDVVTGAYVFVGFLSDKKTIIVYRVSS
ncbi:hypothetical protein [Hymenobacter ruber]